MENFKKVEAYFNNQLNDFEKNDFLKEVESNAELKSEYNFQNEVVNGIKEVRKAELKAMLDKVPIASVTTATTGLYKILAGGAATLLLGTTIWYYFNLATQTENQIVETTLIVEDVKTQNSPNKIAVAEEDVSTEAPIKANTSLKEAKTEKTKIITPNLPNSDDDFADQSLPEEDLNIPNNISKADINLTNKVDVEIRLKKKYSFHYQYLNEKLVLFGDFEEGLFEVLELNKENGIEIYLYYKSNYFYIKDKSGKIIPLKAVSDKNLKLKLERLR